MNIARNKRERKKQNITIWNHSEIRIEIIRINTLTGIALALISTNNSTPVRHISLYRIFLLNQIRKDDLTIVTIILRSFVQ